MVPALDRMDARERAPGAFHWALYGIPIALLLVFAVAVQIHGRLPYPDPAYDNWDHNLYIAMAKDPFGDQPAVRLAPFCWRVLTPWIIHFLPVAVTDGFWMVTLASLSGATISLMWFLRAMGATQSSAVIGGLAFVTLAQATGFTFWDYMVVDPLAFALLVTAFACAVSRRGLWLVVTLFFYALAKETVLFAALFAVVYALERRDWRMLRWSIAGVVIAGAIQLTLHLAIHPTASYSLISEFHRVQAAYGRNVDQVLPRLTDAFAETWSLLLPFAALQLLHRPFILLRPSFVLVLLGATVQILVAINTGRVIVYAFPIIIAAFVFEIDYLAKQSRIPHWLFWVPVLILQIPWYIQQAFPHGYRTTLLSQVDSLIFGLAAGIAIWAVYYWAGRLYFRRGANGGASDQEATLPLIASPSMKQK